MNKRILICDDDRDITEVTSIVLKDNGFTVKSVNSCDLIMEEIKTFCPDLILMDLRIPQKGGEAAIKEIRSSGCSGHIPILIFSADHKAVKIADEIGADGLISKPFDVDVLVEIIRSNLAPKK